MAAIAFKDAMRTATQDETGRAILDLSEVTFIDSSGLGAIVAALKQMPDGTALELACLSSCRKGFQPDAHGHCFQNPQTTASDVSRRCVKKL